MSEHDKYFEIPEYSLYVVTERVDWDTSYADNSYRTERPTYPNIFI